MSHLSPLWMSPEARRRVHPGLKPTLLYASRIGICVCSTVSPEGGRPIAQGGSPGYARPHPSGAPQGRQTLPTSAERTRRIEVDPVPLQQGDPLRLETASPAVLFLVLNVPAGR